MLGIAVLGAGRIGHVHATTLAHVKGARLVAVSDALPDAAARLASETGAEAMATDAAIRHPDVDAVVIAAPTSAHFDLIAAAADAGKAIFCEKPIDLDRALIEQSLERVAAAGVPFMTAFQRRFDPSFAALERRLRAGEIGKVELVTILSRDPSPPPIPYIRSSGGIFRDMTIHDFDMARFLLGEDPVGLHAVGACHVDPAIGEAGDVDTAAVTLWAPSGALVQISNSRRASYGYDQRVEVHGADGMLRVGNVLASQVEHADGEGFRRAPTEPFFLERYAEAYRRELAHFVDCVASGTPPNPTGEDGLRAQILADAATRSMRDGAPVAL